MTKAIALILLLSALTCFAEDKPVHVFVFSGQSNMAGMDPETGFVPEARKLFGSEEVVYIKVAKGGQPICRWEGYRILGQRFARQGYALVTGTEPAEDGRP